MLTRCIELHSTRLAMSKRHLPLPRMAVLMGTAAIGASAYWASPTVVRVAGFLCSTLFTGRFLAVALWMTLAWTAQHADLAGVWHDVPVLELGRHWARSSRTQDVRP